jgi:NAD(P)-dependent dehydrogenase (short-subunit alcohol dehydrogenase family)
VNRPLALVTGGMRRLGAVMAAQLADAGYDLALTSHGDGTPDAELAAALDHNATNWMHFPADLSAEGATETLMSDVLAHFGRAPDLLVNNAAMFGQDGWEELSDDTLDAHFQLNVFAPVLLSRALVQASGEQAQPAIIHIVDQRITNPNGDQLSYTLSKQALAGSVRSLAAAFGRRARVNGVAPGLVIPTDDYDAIQMQRLNEDMPLGQLPDAKAIAETVLYLAKARHVTGQIVFVDGGAHLRSYPRDFMHL